MKVLDLNESLIAQAFDAEGWDYGHSPNGEIVSVFDTARFLVTVSGMEDEILVVTGQVGGEYLAEDAETVDDVIDLWHRTRPWPTCRRSEPDERGRFVIHAEVAGYFPAGLSLEQARTQLRCAVGSTSALAERIRAELREAPTD